MSTVAERSDARPTYRLDNPPLNESPPIPSSNALRQWRPSLGKCLTKIRWLLVSTDESKVRLCPHSRKLHFYPPLIENLNHGPGEQHSCIDHLPLVLTGFQAVQRVNGAVSISYSTLLDSPLSLQAS